MSAMQTIFNNLSDLSWWFTSFFPTVLILLIPRVWRYFFGKIRGLSRFSRKRFLKKVKAKRLDDLMVQKEMLSAHAAFNFFAVWVSAGLVILLTNSSSVSGKSSIGFSIVIAFPLLISEIVWLLKDARVDELIERRQRWLAGRKKAMRCEVAGEAE